MPFQRPKMLLGNSGDGECGSADGGPKIDVSHDIKLMLARQVDLGRA